MKRRTATFILAITMTTLLTAGCGGSGNTGSESETETRAEETVPVENETEKPEIEDASKETQTETLQEADVQTEAQETEAPKIEEPKDMYALDDVYLRVDMDPEAEALAVVNRGSQLTVTATDGEWCRVSADGQEGYILKKFLTESEEEAQSAVAAEEAARQAEEEAAAAAAQQAAQNQGSGKTEVSRQNFDDCDGSGHGYTLITYSDGSTETVEY